MKRDKRKTNGASGKHAGHMSLVPPEAKRPPRPRDTCVCIIMPGMPCGIGADTLSTLDGMRRQIEGAGARFFTAAVQGMSYEHALSEVTAIALQGTPAEDFFYLDTDIAFDPRWILKFAMMEEEILCGTYQQRTAPENWCVNNVSHGDTVQKTKIAPDKAHGVQLCEINDTGFGAVRVRRHVLDRLASLHPELEYVSTRRMPRPAYSLWDPFIFEHGGVRRRTAGDTCWFKRARDAGYRIWAIADMPIDHARMGSCSFMRWLQMRQAQEKQLPACVACGRLTAYPIRFEDGAEGPFCGACVEGGLTVASEGP